MIMIVISGSMTMVGNTWAQPRGTILPEPGWSNMTTPPEANTTDNESTTMSSQSRENTDLTALENEITPNQGSNDKNVGQGTSSTNGTNNTSLMKQGIIGNDANIGIDRNQLDKLPLAGDVGGVVTPDPTVDPIPYKCAVNAKTGVKECKSIGIADSIKLYAEREQVCKDALLCKEGQGCTCTAK